MTQDIEFRNRLREMLDSESDSYEESDAEIIKYVLNHAKNQWSASLVHWWYEEGRDYADNFLD